VLTLGSEIAEHFTLLFGKRHNVFLHSQSSQVDYEEILSHHLRHFKVDMTLGFRIGDCLMYQHVPIRYEELICLKAATALRQAMYAVLGFSETGTFSNVILIRPLFPSQTISCVLAGGIAGFFLDPLIPPEYLIISLCCALLSLRVNLLFVSLPVLP
jgi:hypothetical protein